MMRLMKAIVSSGEIGKTKNDKETGLILRLGLSSREAE
jgi:hypothetical protein